MIQFKGVVKSYSNQATVVKNLDLTVNKGEFVCLIGPSGCGKTTTLKMVNRLIEPSKGTISIYGKDIMQQDPVQLRRGIGYVVQQIGLFPHMTISDNIALVPKLLGWSAEDRNKRVDELLPLVGLDPDYYRNRYPRELSGGQQQRVGVIRALAAQPELILMDEPFGAWDPITRDSLQYELKRLQSNLKKTIVFVTHDMDEAMKLADRIILMKDGIVLQDGTPQEFYNRPANDFVKEFIGKNKRHQAEGE
jgi:osmoprotectant transport system ATP-binding protein